MEVLLNQAPCEVDSGISTLAGLVAWVEEFRLPVNEILISISLDGNELADDADLDGLALANGTRVELTSARAIDLARDGLNHAAELLPGLVDEIPHVAAELRDGDVSIGLQMFDECISEVSWYVQLVSALDVLFSPGLAGVEALSADDLSPEDGFGELPLDPVSELRTFTSVENLRQKLLDIEQGQIKRDHRLLADLLEYELLPIVRLWLSDLPQLQSRARAESGQA